jgi:homoserine O-acetyltransferase
MRSFYLIALFCLLNAELVGLASADAADYPTPREAHWTAKDFRFHTGETLPELRIAYTTVGTPSGTPILLLHGTMGSATNYLDAQYAGELFGAGQPMDASKFFIIIPDAIGTGKTSKPSDGLRTKFPRYNYADMIQAQHRLLTEGLGVGHVRLVIGSSMGGMQSWLWAETYPDFMDGIVPLASTPSPMLGRNWLTRRLLIETVKRDPEFNDGNYTAQPATMKLAEAWFSVVASGGTSFYAKSVPNAEAGDKLVSERLNARSRGDANDLIYQYSASFDYDALGQLEKIKVPVLAINSADDERNPPELGVMEGSLKRLSDARLFLIPTGPDTRGHGTTGNAKLWKHELQAFLSRLPEREHR